MYLFHLFYTANNITIIKCGECNTKEESEELIIKEKEFDKKQKITQFKYFYKKVKTQLQRNNNTEKPKEV